MRGAVRAVAPQAGRRSYAKLTYKRPMTGEELYQPKPWENSIEINPKHRGCINDEGMEHFWVSRVYDRLDPGLDMQLPTGRFTVKKWQEWYDAHKEHTYSTHPLPVTQWLEEPGWLRDCTPRQNPALDQMRVAHLHVYDMWVKHRTGQGGLPAIAGMKGARPHLLKVRAQIKQSLTPLVPCDKVLDFIEQHAAGRRIVELQARIGYWTWQLRQREYPLTTAYEEWADPYTRRGHGFVTDVVEESGEEQIARGEHDNDVILLVAPERELDELKEWKGDTLILVGLGALGGAYDVGEYLIKRNEGWRFAAHHRILQWPLYFEHAYVFKRGESDGGEKEGGKKPIQL